MLSPAPVREPIDDQGNAFIRTRAWHAWLSALVTGVNNPTMVVSKKPRAVMDTVSLYVKGVGVSPARTVQLIAVGPNGVEVILGTWVV